MAKKARTVSENDGIDGMVKALKDGLELDRQLVIDSMGESDDNIRALASFVRRFSVKKAR